MAVTDCFIPGQQLLTYWAGARPFLSHELQGHNQQPVCGSWDAISSPVSTAVPSAQNTHPFVGLQVCSLIWQDLRLAVPSQKASADLWGIYGAPLGTCSKGSFLSWSVCWSVFLA